MSCYFIAQITIHDRETYRKYEYGFDDIFAKYRGIVSRERICPIDRRGERMFSKSSGKGYRKLLEGVRFKTLVYGEKTLMSEFRMERGATIPMHRHPHEQTGYLISGTMRFSIAKEEVSAEAGDSWCIPGEVEHGAEALENCVVVEIFSPVRKEYLP